MGHARRGKLAHVREPWQAESLVRRPMALKHMMLNGIRGVRVRRWAVAASLIGACAARAAAQNSWEDSTSHWIAGTLGVGRNGSALLGRTETAWQVAGWLAQGYVSGGVRYGGITGDKQRHTEDVVLLAGFRYPTPSGRDRNPRRMDRIALGPSFVHGPTGGWFDTIGLAVVGEFLGYTENRIGGLTVTMCAARPGVGYFGVGLTYGLGSIH